MKSAISNNLTQPVVTQAVKKLNDASSNATKVLFLGYKENETHIIKSLIDKDCAVWHTEDKIQSTIGFDMVVSFGYRHILKKEVITSSPAPIVNLHISYLPFNRGAHPNFWSFFDGTPSGVSIHLIDEGIDTGPVLFQRYVNFEKEEKTFMQTYKRLICEIEDLFMGNIDPIVLNKLEPKPQRRKGTHHKVSDLPKDFAGWGSIIDVEIDRLEGIIKDDKAAKLKLIDEIEIIRTANNVNWMDLLRLAFREAPEQAKELIKRINIDDRKIADLFAKLGE